MSAGFVPGYPVPRGKRAEKGESCVGCGKRFTFFTSKSNCPNCGRLFCSDCLQAECAIVPGGTLTPVCLPCFSMLEQHKRSAQTARGDQRYRRLSELQSTEITDSSAAPPTRGDAFTIPAADPGSSRPTPPAGPAPVDSERVELQAQVDNLLLKSKELRGENEMLVTQIRLKDDVISSATEELLREKEAGRQAQERVQHLEEVASTTAAELAELREETRRTAAKQGQLDAEVAAARAALAEQTAQALENERAAQARIDALTGDAQRESSTEVHTALAAAGTRVSELEAELAALRQREGLAVGDLQQELGALRQELDSTVRALTEAQAESEKHAQAGRNLEAEVHSLQHRLQEADREQRSHHDASNAEHAERCAELEAEIAALAARNIDSENALALAKDEVVRLANEKQNVENQLTTSTDNLEQQMAEVAQQSQRCAALEAELSAARDALARSAAEESTSQDSTIALLTRQVEELQGKRAALEGDLASAQEELSRLRNEKDLRRSQAQDGEAALQRHITEMNRLHEEYCGQLREEVRAALESASNQATAFQETQASKPDFAVEVKKLRAKVKDAAQAERNLIVQVKEHKETAESLLAEKRALEQRGKDMQRVLKELRQNVTVLKEEVTERADAEEKVRLQLADVTKEAEKDQASLRVQIAALQKELSMRETQQNSVHSAAAPNSSDHGAVVPILLPRDGTSRWRQPSRVPALTFNLPGRGMSREPAEALDVEAVFQWGFDVKAAVREDQSILQQMGRAAAVKMDLFPHEADSLHCWNFMMGLLEANYHDNPYHNAVHAADVMQGVCALVLAAPELLRNMTRVERLAAVFAAASHDVRHPGRPQSFLRQLFDPVYLAFNGRGTLEQMHTATAFTLLAVPEADFTAGLTDAEALEFHAVVSRLVLYTDMACHGEGFARWQTKAVGGEYNYTVADDRIDVLALLLHTADVGAQAKGLTIALKWLGVVEEMRQQGAEEQERGFAVSPGCASAKRAEDEQELVAQGQLFFLRSVVAPLFLVVHALFPHISRPLENLREVHEWYQSRCADTQPFPQLAVSGAPVIAEGNGTVSERASSSQARDDESQKRLQQARALRDAHAKVKQAAAAVAAREASLEKRENALRALEERVMDDLQGTTHMARRQFDSDGPMNTPQSTPHGTSTLTARDLSRSPESAFIAEIERRLLSATKKVVEKERQLRARAVEVDAQASDLAARERLTAALSDQLTAIAERVNAQRKKLSLKEAELSGKTLDGGLPVAHSRGLSPVPGPSRVSLREGNQVVLERLAAAVASLNSAVHHAA